MSQTPLDEIRADHRHMAVLLDLLRSDVEALRAGDERLDLERLDDLMAYFAEYPDRIHHPREETLFSLFRERFEPAPELEEALRQAHEQHASLPELGRSLRARLDAAAHDAPVLRASLVEDLEAFIEAQRAHIDLEEGLIFPELAAKLGGEAWRQARRLGPEGVDPLFGGQVAAGYQALYDRLKTFAP